MAELVTCSCGAIVPELELEAHMANHGIEPDTYAGARIRRFLADHEGDVDPGDPDAAEREDAE